MAIQLCGCAHVSTGTRIVLTTGLKPDEVFRIDTVSCTRPEMMVYLTNIQNQYENVYGEEIWQTSVDGVTLEKRVKDNALAKMAQVKTMNLMAHSMDIRLSQQEIRSAENAAGIYYDSLNTTEIEAMGIDKSTIVSLYTEYLLASKVYHEIIEEINPEISDDEARNVTIEYILIRTFTTGDDGERVDMDEDARLKAYARAKEAYSRAAAGEDFDLLIAEYSDSAEMTASYSKADIDSDYIRDALFNLSKDEISPILSCNEGYMIARLISTNDTEETDQNKVRIVQKRREKAFAEEYDSYVEKLTRKLNEALWEDITFLHDDEITTCDFFTVADENLKLDSL